MTKPRGPFTRICPVCGEVFTCSTKRRFCSPMCSAEGHRRYLRNRMREKREREWEEQHREITRRDADVAIGAAERKAGLKSEDMLLRDAQTAAQALDPATWKRLQTMLKATDGRYRKGDRHRRLEDGRYRKD